VPAVVGTPIEGTGVPRAFPNPRYWRMAPPPARRKLMPLAQSRELPPPSATIEPQQSHSTVDVAGRDHSAIGNQQGA
jgi:hypothetical protein